MNITTFVDNTVQGATSYWYRVRMYNDGGDSPYSNVASVTTPNPPAPSAPTGLTATATAISSTQIALSWTDTSNVESGFAIERLNGTIWSTVGTTGANQTSWTNSSLSPQTTYVYRVRATNVSGSSPYSNTAQATTFSAAQDVPIRASAAATSATKVTLYWKTVSGATGYNVYRSTTAGSNYTKITSSPVNSVDPGPGASAWRIYSDVNLITGSTYYYKVAAVPNRSPRRVLRRFHGTQEALRRSSRRSTP